MSRRRGAGRREQILRAAVKLFLKNGVSGTSMQQLAREVGVTATGLYYYFKSKQDIVNSMIEIPMGAVERLVGLRHGLGDVSPTVALTECVKHHVLRGEASRDFHVFITREILAIEPRRRRVLLREMQSFISFFVGILEEGIKAGEFEMDDPLLVAFNIWTLPQEWALRRWYLRDFFTIDEYAAKQTAAILWQVLVDKRAVPDRPRGGSP
jgi:AcrR family transcriptional regulator